MTNSGTISHFDSFDAFHDATHENLEDIFEHSVFEYNQFHDYLIEELGRIGSVDEGGLEDADFSVDRTVGDSLPIGVVVETKIQGVVECVRAALARTDVEYSVNLDLEDSDITVFKDGRIAVYSEDLDPAVVLQSLAP